MKEQEIENRLNGLKTKGVLQYPMLGNEKLFLKTWEVGEIAVALKLGKGYGVNEERIDHTILRTDIEDFFVQMRPIKPSITPVKVTETKVNERNVLEVTAESDTTMTTTDNMVTDLRTELFTMVKSLSVDSKKIEQAKAMASVAQVILNAFKVELEIKKFKKQ